MPHENPYAVSELDSHPELMQDGFDLLDPKQFRLEFPFIVCGKKVQLPEVCVLSGETDDLVSARKTIHQHSWKFEVFGRDVKASFFLSRRRRRQMRIAYFGGLLMSLAGITLGVGFLQTRWSAISVFTGIFLFLAGAWIHSRGSVPLFISHHARGKKFWLTGFSPQFFQSLQRLCDTSENHHAP